jgi:hypothetical protein
MRISIFPATIGTAIDRTASAIAYAYQVTEITKGNSEQENNHE